MTREFKFFKPKGRDLPFGSMPEVSEFLDAYSYLAGQLDDDGECEGIEVLLEKDEAEYLRGLGIEVYRDYVTGEYVLGQFDAPEEAWCVLRTLIDQGIRASDDDAFDFAGGILDGLGFIWDE